MFTALWHDRPSTLWQFLAGFPPIGGLYLVGLLNSWGWVTLLHYGGYLATLQICLSLIKLLYSGTSVTDCPGRPRENSSHPWVPECVFISCGYSGVITARSLSWAAPQPADTGSLFLSLIVGWNIQPCLPQQQERWWGLWLIQNSVPQQMVTACG